LTPIGHCPSFKSMNPSPICLRLLTVLLRGVLLLVLLARGADAAEGPPLKALVISGGCCHDYKKLLPHLTTNISAMVKVTFEVKYDLEILDNEKFAEPFDVLIFDQCQEEGTAMQVRNALAAVRAGKPTVMIHCALHAFKSSSDWRDCCGMTSKVHDPFQAFDTEAEAADFAVGTEWWDSGEAYGVQFADGSTLRLEEWDAYAVAVRERDARKRSEVPPTPAVPIREAKCPFTGLTVPIYSWDEAPDWLGQ